MDLAAWLGDFRVEHVITCGSVILGMVGMFVAGVNAYGKLVQRSAAMEQMIRDGFADNTATHARIEVGMQGHELRLQHHTEAIGELRGALRNGKGE